MKIEIISRKSIKPSTPTPPHLRTFKLSLFDQLQPPYFGSFVFFYPSPPNNGGDDIISKFLDKSRLLQKSLSEILVLYYPMAGERKDEDITSIDCNDKGAYFVEARINCQLVDSLRQPDSDLVESFIPANDPNTIELAHNSTLLVQLTVFDCGGIAVAISFSHKIADAFSDYTFTQSWAAILTGKPEKVVVPKFIEGSSLAIKRIQNSAPEKCTSTTTRRFVFDATKIAALRAKIGHVGDATGQQRRGLPTNVEAVTALIVKYAIVVAQSAQRPSLVLQLVNLRKRVVPPMPENTIGNPIWTIEMLLKDGEIELNEIVAKMRQELTDLMNKFRSYGEYKVTLDSLKERKLLMDMGVKTYSCTSLCKMPFYEIDFGWGKPVWVVSRVPKNFTILMDTKNRDGIEAWVTLDEQEMIQFEQNEEFLAFASKSSPLLSIAANDRPLYATKSRL